MNPSEFYVIREADRDKLDRLLESIDDCKKRNLRPIRKDELTGAEGLMVFVGGGGILDRARVQSVQRDSKGYYNIAVRCFFSV